MSLFVCTMTIAL